MKWYFPFHFFEFSFVSFSFFPVFLNLFLVFIVTRNHFVFLPPYLSTYPVQYVFIFPMCSYFLLLLLISLLSLYTSPLPLFSIFPRDTVFLSTSLSLPSFYFIYPLPSFYFSYPLRFLNLLPLFSIFLLLPSIFLLLPSILLRFILITKKNPPKNQS